MTADAQFVDGRQIYLRRNSVRVLSFEQGVSVATATVSLGPGVCMVGFIDQQTLSSFGSIVLRFSEALGFKFSEGMRRLLNEPWGVFCR